MNMAEHITTIIQNAIKRRIQRPHPTTIAKIMIARIMRTAMLSMNRIIGTTIKPSQLIKMAGI
jgi:hypothetical protein